MGYSSSSNLPPPEWFVALHARVVERWPARPVRVTNWFSHWEDEDLGIAGQEEAWTAVTDARTRAALAAIGLSNRSRWEGTWAAGEIDEIVNALERLAALPIRILRRERLPAGVPWIDLQLARGLAEADEVSISTDGGSFSVKVGANTSIRTNADGIAFLEWWRTKGRLDA